MACIEARTLTIDGSNPARDVSNSRIVITLKAVAEKISLRNEFFSILKFFSPTNALFIKHIKC
jgi:hypothetical protein